jgi:hypothetical protein
MEDITLYKLIKQTFLEENPNATVHDVRKTAYDSILIMYTTPESSPKLNIKTIETTQALAWIREKRLKDIGL